MAIKGISKVEIEDYISQSDEAKNEKDGATVFELGVLTAAIKASIGDKAMVMEQGDSGSRFFINSGTRNLEAVRFGLKGWRNFKDDKGNDIPFETVTRIVGGAVVQVASDDTLNHIPSWLMAELGTKVLEINTMTADMEKNLQTG